MFLASAELGFVHGDVFKVAPSSQRRRAAIAKAAEMQGPQQRLQAQAITRVIPPTMHMHLPLELVDAGMAGATAREAAPIHAPSPHPLPAPAARDAVLPTAAAVQGAEIDFDALLQDPQYAPGSFQQVALPLASAAASAASALLAASSGSAAALARSAHRANVLSKLNASYEADGYASRESRKVDQEQRRIQEEYEARKRAQWKQQRMEQMAQAKADRRNKAKKMHLAATQAGQVQAQAQDNAAAAAAGHAAPAPTSSAAPVAPSKLTFTSTSSLPSTAHASSHPQTGTGAASVGRSSHVAAAATPVATHSQFSTYDPSIDDGIDVAALPLAFQMPATNAASAAAGDAAVKDAARSSEGKSKHKAGVSVTDGSDADSDVEGLLDASGLDIAQSLSMDAFATVAASSAAILERHDAFQRRSDAAKESSRADKLAAAWAMKHVLRDAENMRNGLAAAAAAAALGGGLSTPTTSRVVVLRTPSLQQHPLHAGSTTGSLPSSSPASPRKGAASANAAAVGPEETDIALEQAAGGDDHGEEKEQSAAVPSIPPPLPPRHLKAPGSAAGFFSGSSRSSDVGSGCASPALTGLGSGSGGGSVSGTVLTVGSGSGFSTVLVPKYAGLATGVGTNQIQAVSGVAAMRGGVDILRSVSLRGAQGWGSAHARSAAHRAKQNRRQSHRVDQAVAAETLARQQAHAAANRGDNDVGDALAATLDHTPEADGEEQQEEGQDEEGQRHSSSHRGSSHTPFARPSSSHSARSWSNRITRGGIGESAGRGSDVRLRAEHVAAGTEHELRDLTEEAKAMIRARTEEAERIRLREEQRREDEHEAQVLLEHTRGQIIVPQPPAPTAYSRGLSDRDTDTTARAASKRASTSSLASSTALVPSKRGTAVSGASASATDLPPVLAALDASVALSLRNDHLKEKTPNSVLALDRSQQQQPTDAQKEKQGAEAESGDDASNDEGDEGDAVASAHTTQRRARTAPGSRPSGASSGSTLSSTQIGGAAVFPSWLWSRPDFQSSYSSVPFETCLRILQLFPDERTELHISKLREWIHARAASNAAAAAKAQREAANVHAVPGSGSGTPRHGPSLSRSLSPAHSVRGPSRSPSRAASRAASRAVSRSTSRSSLHSSSAGPAAAGFSPSLHPAPPPPLATTVLPPSGVDYLASLPPLMLDGCLRVLKSREYKAGETIYSQGEAGDVFYILQSGRVQTRRVEMFPHPQMASTINAAAKKDAPTPPATAMGGRRGRTSGGLASRQQSNAQLQLQLGLSLSPSQPHSARGLGSAQPSSGTLHHSGSRSARGTGTGGASSIRFGANPPASPPASSSFSPFGGSGGMIAGTETLQLLLPGAAFGHDHLAGSLESSSQAALARKRTLRLWHLLRLSVRRGLREQEKLYTQLSRLTYSNSAGDPDGAAAQAKREHNAKINARQEAARTAAGVKRLTLQRTISSNTAAAASRRGSLVPEHPAPDLPSRAPSFAAAAASVSGGSHGSGLSETQLRRESAVALTDCLVFSLSFYAYASLDFEASQSLISRGVSFLGSLPFFASWSFGRLRHLYSLMVPRTLRKGEVLWKQGSPAEEMAFVVEGSLGLWREALVTEGHRFPRRTHGQWVCEEREHRVGMLSSVGAGLRRPFATVESRDYLGEELVDSPVRDFTVRVRSDRAVVWLLRKRYTHLLLLKGRHNIEDVLRLRRAAAATSVAQALAERYPAHHATKPFPALDWATARPGVKLGYGFTPLGSAFAAVIQARTPEDLHHVSVGPGGVGQGVPELDLAHQQHFLFLDAGAIYVRFDPPLTRLSGKAAAAAVAAARAAQEIAMAQGDLAAAAAPLPLGPRPSKVARLFTAPAAGGYEPPLSQYFTELPDEALGGSGSRGRRSGGAGAGAKVSFAEVVVAATGTGLTPRSPERRLQQPQ